MSDHYGQHGDDSSSDVTGSDTFVKAGRRAESWRLGISGAVMS